MGSLFFGGSRNLLFLLGQASWSVVQSISIYFLSFLFCTDWEFGKCFKWETVNVELTSLCPLFSWELGSAYASLRSSFYLCSTVRLPEVLTASLPFSPSPLPRFLDFALYQESAIVLRESVAHSRSAPFSELSSS